MDINGLILAGDFDPLTIWLLAMANPDADVNLAPIMPFLIGEIIIDLVILAFVIGFFAFFFKLLWDDFHKRW